MRKPIDRINHLFRYYLSRDLDDVMTFKEFIDRVRSGRYPWLLLLHYDDRKDLLESDLASLKEKMGW